MQSSLTRRRCSIQTRAHMSGCFQRQVTRANATRVSTSSNKQQITRSLTPFSTISHFRLTQSQTRNPSLLFRTQQTSRKLSTGVIDHKNQCPLAGSKTTKIPQKTHAKSSPHLAQNQTRTVYTNREEILKDLYRVRKPLTGDPVSRVMSKPHPRPLDNIPDSAYWRDDLPPPSSFDQHNLAPYRQEPFYPPDTFPNFVPEPPFPVYPTKPSDVHIWKTTGGGSKHMVLHRPETANSMDLDMTRYVKGVLRKWNRSTIAFAMGIQGSLDAFSFCTGYDMRDFVGKHTLDHARETLTEFYELCLSVNTVGKPLFVIMNGLTVGAGASLACLAPFRVANFQSDFSLPQVKNGWIPDAGMTWFLANKLPEGLGMMLGLTGYRLKGADLYHIGIANMWLDGGAPVIRNFNDRLSERYSDNFDRTMEVLYEVICEPTVPFSLVSHMDMIRTVFWNTESFEELMELLDQFALENHDRFAIELRDSMLKSSPQALRVTYELIKRAHRAEVLDCMRNEWTAAQELLKTPETQYGLRCALQTFETPKYSSSWKEISAEKFLVDPDYPLEIAPASKYVESNLAELRETRDVWHWRMKALIQETEAFSGNMLDWPTFPRQFIEGSGQRLPTAADRQESIMLKYLQDPEKNPEPEWNADRLLEETTTFYLPENGLYENIWKYAPMTWDSDAMYYVGDEVEDSFREAKKRESEEQVKQQDANPDADDEEYFPQPWDPEDWPQRKK